ncbi:hypothetical protein MMC17_003206 [Xylographa soralifera]|nr:hypothetical protein [Xylographa soralifera]
MAAQQNVTRSDLASWDASARAWLLSADEAKAFEQTQLHLIVKNSGLTVSSEAGTYASVIDSWFVAMSTLDKIICGMPHSVSKGSILIGISAWHIFPDLDVVGNATKAIQFKDPLVSEGGNVTIGLQSIDPNNDIGVQWSLALSHLRFYGDPVAVSRFSGLEGFHMTMNEFRLVALGSVLADWGTSGESTFAAADFFILLDSLVARPLRIDDSRRLTAHWLRPLVVAAESFVGSKGSEMENASMFVNYGRRRGRSLVGQKEKVPPPLFGLSNPLVLYSLSSEFAICDEERKIAILRDLAAQCQLRADECIICIRKPGITEQNREIPFELTTARPVHQSYDSGSAKRDIDDASKLRTVHRRWSTFFRHRWDEDYTQILKESPFFGNGAAVLRWVRAPPMFKPVEMNPIHNSDLSQFQDIHHSVLRDRLDNSLFSSHITIENDIIQYDGMAVKRSAGGQDIPCMTRQRIQQTAADGKLIWVETLCQCYDAVEGMKNLYFFAGDTAAAIYTLEDPRLIDKELQSKTKPTRLLPSLDLESVLAFLRAPYVQLDKLLEYLRLLPQEGIVSRIDNTKFRTIYSQQYMRSLENLATASEIYENIPQARIAMSIINRPLYEARWGYSISSGPMRTHASIFSCIAMLESGTCNIDPQQLDQVFAMSCGNSIYVAAPLLQDPFQRNETTTIKRIVGNLGRGGISMLVPPTAPRIRPLSPGRWQQVQHRPFDGKMDDHFNHTSIHLTFTQYEVPLVSGERGSVDPQAVLLESLVSVHDSGEWVADLDVVGALRSCSLFQRVPQPSNSACSHITMSATGTTKACLVSVDNWEELIDNPEDLNDNRMGVVRAHGNWLARLAVASVSVQKGLRTLVLPTAPVICWHCTE